MLLTNVNLPKIWTSLQPDDFYWVFLWVLRFHIDLGHKLIHKFKKLCTSKSSGKNRFVAIALSWCTSPKTFLKTNNPYMNFSDTKVNFPSNSILPEFCEVPLVQARWSWTSRLYGRGPLKGKAVTTALCSLLLLVMTLLAQAKTCSEVKSKGMVGN